MTPVLEGRDVSLQGRLHATDLDVRSGELVAVIGPNGSGKTSLLRALAGVERSSGSVHVLGEELDRASTQRRPLLASFLPASREAVWPVSARDVIALGLPQPDAGRVEELIQLLQLEALADRPVDQLSTGERARVLLARALAPSPKVLLLDEPLSNLDPYWVLRILDVLRTMVAEGRSAVVSLHDIDRIGAFDRVLLMAGGRIAADLPPTAMLASGMFSEVFRIEKDGEAWRIRTREDRRSSP